MKRRNFWISLFVSCFILIFHYESLRAFYLNPLFKTDLPKFKFLFPPAGWIMFYNVNRSYGGSEIYGVKGSIRELIDPHRIFETKAILYDNIHRNVLSVVMSPYRREDFCRFLRRKFPEYDRFLVVNVFYPFEKNASKEKISQVVYSCE